MSEQYRQTLRRRLKQGLALQILGTVFIVLSVVMIFLSLKGKTLYEPDARFAWQLFGILGGNALGMIGHSRRWKAKRLLAHEDEARQAEIAENDERNLKITALSWQTAGTLMMVLLYVCALVALMLVQLPVFFVCISLFVVFFAARWYLSIIYEEKL